MPAEVTRPHYLLFTEAGSREAVGHWRFVVQSLDNADQVEIADVESGVCGDRLDLLTVIRGLESLDQPSRVTLVTSSRYVKKGIDEGLAEWREKDWTWERFGERVRVKHDDLWRRLDNALGIHDVQCRRWRLDAAHLADMPRSPSAMPEITAAETGIESSKGAAVEPMVAPQMAATVAVEPERAGRSVLAQFWRRLRVKTERWVSDQAQGLQLKASQCGTGLLPAPWLE